MDLITNGRTEKKFLIGGLNRESTNAKDNTTYLTRIFMDNEEIFEVTKVMNNIKNHDFSVQTYRATKEESEILLKALKNYLLDLKNDSRLEY